ncbi:LL-diaminopimelate aminotransferase [Hydrogenispora ethanolica]|uniref:LL-diaminopimelate aminotransferase n=1 Tax=Hydrogenispora ethanolica TaxID=1082276 RepID=A0A4R1R9L4_HYDET|nr:aminotransferase class I/II-fold pyridoxal phosphate-dependent enzyme [Hydrogenispora ethanolica]TCL62413.1 LL-diaminopimelate aminotransferase [Hydrogenispora ethanolica]
MQFAKRTEALNSAIFAQLDQRKKALLQAGRDAIDFSIGTPDLAPAPHIMRALHEEALRPENYRYAIADLPELVESVQQWYQRRFAVELQPDEILSMNGSQDGLAHIALTLADPGDVVLVPDPGYPIFSVGPQLAGAELYKMPLLAENDYLIDFAAIPPAVARRARLMIVSYPNNPVTAVAPPAFYERLIAFAREYGIAVLHDNAYCELVFDGAKGGSFLNYPGAKEIGLEFNSLSKSYNIPGPRLSFAVGNRELIAQLRKLKSHLDYGIFLPLQKAAIAALNGPQDCVAATVRAYQERRDLLIEGLGAIGWPIPRTPATMFMWAPIPARFRSSLEFTFELMERTGVIVVPGSSFGDGGEGYVRLAMVQPTERIQKAIAQIDACGILR